MKAIIICPENRPCCGVFLRMKPLALMSIMGRSLLDHSLVKLKREGFTDVTVLAVDRPEVIRMAIGKGQAWGLKVEVVAIRRELSIEDAEIEHGGARESGTRPKVITLDEIPGLAESALWKTNVATFDAIRRALDTPELAAQLTMQEVSPNVWISTKARVSEAAEIVGPVWIGPHASIKGGAKVGPFSVIEPSAFVDSYARVEESWVGPGTYVGANTTLGHSCAWGNGLLSWCDGSFMEVRDSFLLGDMARPVGAVQRCSVWERAAALLLMVITLPMAALQMLRSWLMNEAVFSDKRVILPQPHRVDVFPHTHALLRLNHAGTLFQRWPELWTVVRGDLALVGNRPLSPEEVTALRGHVGQLWLESPAGLFSLADAERADAESIADSLEHAAFFTTQRSTRLRIRILGRCIGRFLFPFNPGSSTAAAHSTTL